MSLDDVEPTARRMLVRYGADAHMHASYNAMNNDGKNDRAAAFWRAVADEIKRINREHRS